MIEVVSIGNRLACVIGFNGNRLKQLEFESRTKITPDKETKS